MAAHQVRDLEARAEVFELYADTNSGNARVEDLGTMLRSLGCAPSNAAVEQIVELHGRPATLTRETFLAIDTASLPPPPSEDELRAALRVVGANNSLGVEKLRAVLSRCGEGMSESEWQELASRLPSQGATNVDVDALARTMVAGCPVALRSPEAEESKAATRRLSASVSPKKPLSGEAFYSSLALEHLTKHAGTTRWDVHGALLFVDISGFTKATQALWRHGAHVLSEAVNGYLSKLIAVVGAHGGDIVKFAGDAIVVLWWDCTSDSASPLPQAASRRAAMCAMALQSQAGTYDVGSENIQMRLHIGLECGPMQSVLIGTLRERGAVYHMLTGAPLRTIGSLVDAAKPGEVCISGGAWEELLLCGHPSGESRGNSCWLLRSVDDSSAPNALVTNDNVNARKKTYRDLAASKDEEGTARRMVPRLVNEFLRGGIPPQSIAELRTLVALFASLPANDSDIEGICEVVEESGATIVQLMDDDKGLHAIIAFNVSHAQDEAADAAVGLAGELVGSWPSIVVGVATGESFLGVVGSPSRCSFDILGVGVNMACRMMQLGHSKQVHAVFTESVYQSCNNRTHLTFLENAQVKGRADAIGTYTLQSSSMRRDPTQVTSAALPLHTKEANNIDSWVSGRTDRSCRMKVLEGHFGSGRWTLAMHGLMKDKDMTILPVSLTERDVRRAGSLVAGLLVLLMRMQRPAESRILSNAKFDPAAASDLERGSELVALYESVQSRPTIAMWPEAAVAEASAHIAELFVSSCRRSQSPPIGIAVRHTQRLDPVSLAILRRLVEEPSPQLRLFVVGTHELHFGMPRATQLFRSWGATDVLAVDALSEEEATVLLETTVQKEWGLSCAKLRASCSRTLNRFASNHTASLIALGKYMRLNAPLKVYEDKTLGLSQDDTTKLLLTPWTKILPRASGIYIGEYDRLSALHQLLAKVVAVVLTEGQLLVVSESLVMEVAFAVVSFSHSDIAGALSELVEQSVLSRVRGTCDSVAFDHLLMRDAIAKLLPPGIVAEICRAAVAALLPLIKVSPSGHNYALCGLLCLACDDVSSAVENLVSAVRHSGEDFDGEECVKKVYLVVQNSDSLRGPLGDTILEALAEQNRKIELRRKSSASGLRVFKPAFDVDALPYVDDSAYDIALKSMCIQVNSVSIMMKVSGSATLDDVLGLSKAAALYAEEVKRVARYSNFHDTDILLDAVRQFLVTETTEMSVARMEEMERALTAFLQDGAKRLIQAVEKRQSVLNATDIVWTSDYANGWDEQDSQHKWLVDHIGDFQKLLREATAKNEALDPSVVGNTLDALSAYVVFHFEMEEAIMDEIGYPRVTVHKGIHKYFVDKVAAVQTRVLQGDVSAVTVEFMTFLFTWLITHIHGEDVTYANWVFEHQPKEHAATFSASKVRHVEEI